MSAPEGGVVAGTSHQPGGLKERGQSTEWEWYALTEERINRVIQFHSNDSGKAILLE